MHITVVDDIIVYQDKFLGKVKYFMVSESRGKYIKLTKVQYEFFKDIIPLCIQAKQTKEVETYLRQTTSNCSVDKLYKIFQKYNLLLEEKQERKNSVELEFTSTKLFQVTLDRFQEKHQRLLKFAWIMLLIISICTVLATGILFYINKAGLLEQLDQVQYNSYKDMLSMNTIFLLIGFIWSIMCHELGHLLTANHYGMKWKNINVGLRWGVNFVYYVKYKNFYAHSSVIKLKIILAGVLMNLIQVFFYLSWYLINPSIEVLVLLTINLFGILSNINPNGTGDGYHAFCIIAGLEGIRWKMLHVVSEIIKSPRKIKTIYQSKLNIGLLLYFVISYIVSVYTCFKVLTKYGDYFSVINNEKVRYILFSLVVCYFCLGITLNIYKLIKNLKGM